MIILLVGIIALSIALSFEALVVMLTWNYLAPTIIPLHDIDFLHAVCVVILSSLVFGRFSNYLNNASRTERENNNHVDT